MTEPGAVDTRLAEIEQREQAATPGPWKVWAMAVLVDPVGDSNLATALHIADTADPHRGLRTFNAEFIAHARADVPWLLSQLRDARAENNTHLYDAEQLTAKVDKATRALESKEIAYNNLERDRNTYREAWERAARAEAALAAVRELAEQWRHVEPVGFYPEASAHANAIENCGDALIDLLDEHALAAAEQDKPKWCEYCGGCHTQDQCPDYNTDEGEPGTEDEPKRCEHGQVGAHRWWPIVHELSRICPGPVSQPTEPQDEPKRCEHIGCDRKAEHPGSHLARCLHQGCTDPVGHRGRHTTGTYNCIGWAVSQPTEGSEQ